jgi:hypothetical protein
VEDRQTSTPESNSQHSVNALQVLLAWQANKENPELLKAVPEELKSRLMNGDLEVLPDLMRALPELFIETPLKYLQDSALSRLVSRKDQHSPTEE